MVLAWVKLFGMNTEPASAAASAAFCSRAPSRFQLQKSTAKPAIATRHVSIRREPDEDEPVLAVAVPGPGAAPRDATAARDFPHGGRELPHEEEHTALGVGSKRNTLWSSSMIDAPKIWVTKSCRILT